MKCPMVLFLIDESRSDLFFRAMYAFQIVKFPLPRLRNGDVGFGPRFFRRAVLYIEEVDLAETFSVLFFPSPGEQF